MECVSAFLHFYLFENSICLCTLGNKLASTPSVLTCHSLDSLKSLMVKRF